jgi:hypothetical protein
MRDKGRQMTKQRRIVLVVVAAAWAVGAGALMAGCGGNGAAARPKPAAAAPTRFDPANFGDPARGANAYLPVVPGTQWVREGSTLVGSRKVPHQVTTTVTDVYRTVAGMRTVAMLDYELDGGQVAQVSIDYVAEDKAGNLWVLGGYTEQYEGGRYVSAQDAWLAGVRGAKAGILVQAHPKAGTPPYPVAQPDAEEGDVAQVIKVGTHRCVPFKCFDDVLIVREGKASAPDNEFKYYARDVGQIDNVPRGASVHKDVERLINVSSLSAKGLAEASAETLKLDHHAPRTAPQVFGKQPIAKRA